MDKYNDWAICKGCGTQYADVAANLPTCPICDDPRQYVPPTGQAWTTLAALRKDHRNTFQQDPVEKQVWSVFTEPKFAIGQRALLIETPAGNVLWDLISLIDQETVDFIRSVGTGKLSAIVISHPHFYTTNRVWAEIFDCPVYVASEDIKWLYTSPDSSGNSVKPVHGTKAETAGTESAVKQRGQLKQIHDINTEIMEGMTAIKCGGHFPGSLCIHYKNMLFSSDTIMTIQTARNPEDHIFEGTNAYSFMWSIPNMIPLDPKTIYQIWSRINPFDFDTTFGNVPGLDVKNKQAKAWVLKSAKIQVSKMGWEGKEEGELVLREQLN